MARSGGPERAGRVSVTLCMIRYAAGLLLLVLTGAGAAGSFAQHDTGQSGRHGDGHAQMHDVYKGWHPPNNSKTSCCNDSDCRPTRAYVDPEGRWRAWNGMRWLVIPPERILPTDFAGDGRSHLCEKEEFIYCFAPGPPRS
jgi:hypothetical protein